MSNKAERTRATIAVQLRHLIEEQDRFVEMVEKLLEEDPLKAKQFSDIRVLSKEIKHRHRDIRYHVTLLAMMELKEQDGSTELLMSDLYDEIEGAAHPKRRRHNRRSTPAEILAEQTP